MKNNFYISFLFLIAACSAVAQNFTASTTKNKVAVGEQFEITFTLNGNGSVFQAPALKDFDVYYGPSTSMNTQIINGSFSQTVSYSYVIAARKEGSYSIGPASIIVKGKRVESNIIKIEVGKGATQQQNNSSGNNQSVNANGENLFVRTILSKQKVFQGEQIIVTHKLYTRMNLVGFQNIEFPSYTGFWSEAIAANNQITLSAENVDGVNYKVAMLKQVVLFPQRSGTIEIDPITIECVVREKSTSQSNDIFEQFFGGRTRDVVYTVKSSTVKVTVSPLPQNGKPQDFSGAVGNFSMKEQMNKKEVKVNEAINLSVTISGKGNIKLIDAPKLNLPEGIENYGPKISDNSAVTAGGVSGSKTFDYLLIPRKTGEYKITNGAFSYFDTEKKTYITLESPDFNINVEKGNGNEQPLSMNMSAVKEDVKELGTDIRYIKTDMKNPRAKGNYFFLSSRFYASLFSPLILLGVFFAARRKYIVENSDITKVKSRRATKIAIKRLSVAKKHLEARNKNLFYNEVFRSLYGFLSDKLSIPVSDLSRESVTNYLEKKELAKEKITELISTLDKCEFARYSPSSESGEMGEVYENAIAIITTIEEEVK